jgi:hypothetical protein
VENLFNWKGGFRRKAKEYAGPNTRRWPRYNILEIPALKSVSSNTGAEMQVINISRGGALLESEMRMTPGTRVILKVVTIEGVIQIAGRVLRSSVCSLKGIPRYQSAVAFETPLHILDDLLEKRADASRPACSPSPSSGMSQRDSAQSLSIPVSEGSMGGSGSILGVSASEARDEALREMLKLNDW